MSLCVDESDFSVSSMIRDMPDRIDFPKIMNFIIRILGDLIDEDRFKVCCSRLFIQCLPDFYSIKKINLFRRKDD